MPPLTLVKGRSPPYPWATLLHVPSSCSSYFCETVPDVLCSPIPFECLEMVLLVRLVNVNLSKNGKSSKVRKM